MKKIILLILLLGVVSSPMELKKDVNIFEDEKIVNQYKDHLVDINIDEYSPSVNIINSDDVYDGFNGNVINLSSNSKFKILLNNNYLSNFEFNEGNIKTLFKKDLNSSINYKINESIERIYQGSGIRSLYIDGNTDLKKLNNFKNSLVKYANKRINKVGILVRGSFINNDNTKQSYNNAIELDI